MNLNSNKKWIAALLAPLVWITLLGCLTPHDHNDDWEEPEPCLDHDEWYIATYVEVYGTDYTSATHQCNEILADEELVIEPYIGVGLNETELTDLFVRATTRDGEIIWSETVDLSTAEITETQVLVQVRIDLEREHLDTDILVSATATLRSETDQFTVDGTSMFTPR